MRQARRATLRELREKQISSAVAALPRLHVELDCCVRACVAVRAAPSTIEKEFQRIAEKQGVTILDYAPGHSACATCKELDAMRCAAHAGAGIAKAKGNVQKQSECKARFDKGVRSMVATMMQMRDKSE